jgi:hypothetical protein
LESSAAIFFRDQLRLGRATAVRDAEGFSEILFALERLGSYLTNRIGTLISYRDEIRSIACRSPLARGIPDSEPLHLTFDRLYELVMWARNDALHQGAYARHITAHAIELSIILEDALMNPLGTVGDYMVRDPQCCALWQSLSLIRQ